MTLRQLRKRQGLTLQQVADQLGTTATQVRRLENGERQMTRKWAEAMAPIYQRDAAEILFGLNVPRVEVAGYVGQGAQIHLYNELRANTGLAEGDILPYGASERLREVECPRHLDPATTVALQVVGDSSLPPIDDGWLLFYSRAREADPAEIIGKTCAVRLALDGRMLVKRVRRGFSKGRFNLVGTSGDLIEDAALGWASPIRAILPPSGDLTTDAA